IIAMVKEGRSSNNETLQAAAQVLNQFIFGSSEFTQPAPLAKDTPKQNGELDEVHRQRQEFIKERFETTRGELNTKLNNSLHKTVEANIDPKDSMPEYVKKAAVRDANETLGKLMTSDKRFTQIIDKLWENAFKNNFDKGSTDKIRSAYLSKAKTLLPEVIKKARNEALKGIGRSKASNKETDEKTERKESRPKQSDKKSDIPKG